MPPVAIVPENRFEFISSTDDVSGSAAGVRSHNSTFAILFSGLPFRLERSLGLAHTVARWWRRQRNSAIPRPQPIQSALIRIVFVPSITSDPVHGPRGGLEIDPIFLPSS